MIIFFINTLPKNTLPGCWALVFLRIRRQSNDSVTDYPENTGIILLSYVKSTKIRKEKWIIMAFYCSVLKTI